MRSENAWEQYYDDISDKYKEGKERFNHRNSDVWVNIWCREELWE